MLRRILQFGNPVFWARIVQSGLLCVVAIVMLGAGQSRYDLLGHQLMCSCHCGQILLECNHVSCPDSPVMIAELKQQLSTNSNDAEILAWFAAKYGPTILAAPIRGGFDNAAWIVPIAVFLLATVGTFGIVWLWKRRALQMAGGVGALSGIPASRPLDPQEAALRERVRRETEY
jgi:cytochrome c-type biogenesis protein CcmH/NrfF